jgi:hypothetical protein
VRLRADQEGLTRSSSRFRSCSRHPRSSARRGDPPRDESGRGHDVRHSRAHAPRTVPM